jgi:ubiquinone/menaquinone biosynthesis C-methylase UbiE
MPGHVCPPWLNFLLINPFRSRGHHPRKILRKFVKEGDTVLDAGCGPGHFTIGLAEIVGDKGTVIAADIQEKMLQSVRKRAEKAGVLRRIRLHLSPRDALGVQGPVDFALVFWTAHEVRDKAGFFGDIYECMRPGATLLLVEPKGHVGKKAFAALQETAEKSGLRVLRTERLCLSHAVLFEKAPLEHDS